MKTEYYEVNGKQIKIPIAESYKDCMTLIKSDRFRITGKMESSLQIFLNLLNPYRSTILFWMRLAQYKKSIFHPLIFFMYKRASRKAHVEISPSAKIGYGFYIGHEICILCPNAIIGNNVNISQFDNFGSNHGTTPTIGDNVYIGPHVCSVEDVVIGNNSTIGAGAVITRDIPDNATCVGVPARVINYENPGRYIQNPYNTIQYNTSRTISPLIFTFLRKCKKKVLFCNFISKKRYTFAS